MILTNSTEVNGSFADKRAYTYFIHTYQDKATPFIIGLSMNILLAFKYLSKLRVISMTIKFTLSLKERVFIAWCICVGTLPKEIGNLNLERLNIRAAS